ncbi:glutamate-rich protein 1 isoform X2 [Electrophorus electricus]|uniref:Glutamate-rich 1 n=1 Tax=Electrophorus electricus TaxID=8005 RepID=A0AAY5EH25_ELEEL|nr:glutamate-rich protein 1 isoform X2 [Electrophorus electricus]
MSLRKEVFQAKVLQRLYPAPKPRPATAPGVQPKPRPATAPGVQPKPSSGPADLSGSDGKDGTEDEDMARRRKADVASESGEAGGTGACPPGGAAAQRSEGAVESGQPEPLSRNRKRKMKKKRRKAKLLSSGSAPRPRALEFTYEEDEGERGDEDSRQDLDGVLDFLQTTWDLYLSDRSRASSLPALPSNVAESLFARMSDRTSPPAGLRSFRGLGALLGRGDAGQLRVALQEFSRTSPLPADETLVVCTLFQYWITEVLPMQKDSDT